MFWLIVRRLTRRLSPAERWLLKGQYISRAWLNSYRRI